MEQRKVWIHKKYFEIGDDHQGSYLLDNDPFNESSQKQVTHPNDWVMMIEGTQSTKQRLEFKVGDVLVVGAELVVSTIIKISGNFIKTNRSGWQTAENLALKVQGKIGFRKKILGLFFSPFMSVKGL